jgi:hypothetical protein
VSLGLGLSRKPDFLRTPASLSHPQPTPGAAIAQPPQTSWRWRVFSTENPPGILLNHLKICGQIFEEMIIYFEDFN